MKSFILATLVTLSSVALADAYGNCYHFYNCQGITLPGGFYSLEQCQQAGGLSVGEGSYCENVPPAEQLVSKHWFGTCYLASGCVGVTEGTMTDSQCQMMGGHSMDVGGGACVNF